MGNCLTLEESKKSSEVKYTPAASPSKPKVGSDITSLATTPPYKAIKSIDSGFNRTSTTTPITANKSVGSSANSTGSATTASPSRSDKSADSGVNSTGDATTASPKKSRKSAGSGVKGTRGAARTSPKRSNKPAGSGVKSNGVTATTSSSKPNSSGGSGGAVTSSSSKANTTTVGSGVSQVAKDVNDLRENPGNTNADIFTYEEMKLATENFRPDLILGEGGFGVVYKGVIDDSVRKGYESIQVAIKMLNPEGFQGDREWLAEVNYLGQLSHPNLVKLIGYCCEDEHRFLVYEYMASGCLERHLFRRVCLTMPWPTRIKIALGAAKGLAFLHGLERSVIYRDFKTSNILLDEEYNAKLSDFGLAKDGPMGDQTHVSTRVMGTYGYAAPEYIMTGHLTARSDVYGYGVVLLEMLIGRRALDKSRPSREHNLVDFARPLLTHYRKLVRILDPRMDGQYAIRDAQKVAILTYTCLSQNPKGRPTMSQVVRELESLQLPAIPKDMPAGSGVDCITLYEVPKTPPQVPPSSKKSPSRREGERSPNRQSSSQSKPPKSRSRSEPSVDSDLYCLSPDSNKD